jgi:hypothetical protein
MDILINDVLVERAKYPAALLTADECGAICNAVAWKNRAGGWGVSGKTGGNHAVRHDGERIAVDILHHAPSNHVIDILVAAGERGGAPGPAEPAWQDHGPNTQASRPWVAPIAPQGVQPIPTTPTIPTIPPTVCRFEPTDLGSIQSALVGVVNLLAEIRLEAEDARRAAQHAETAAAHARLAAEDVNAKLSQGFQIDANARFLGRITGTIRP